MSSRRIVLLGIVFSTFIAVSGPSSFASEIVTANGEIPVSGTVMGSYLDTSANDAVYEQIVEWESDERLAKKRKSYLEHKWTFYVSAADAFVFYVKAYHSANTEGDDFEFAWSVDDADYTGILVVTKTQDDGTYQSAALPSNLNGTVYIRVTDTDRTKDHRVLDTVFIDHMYIESTVNESPPAAPSGLQATALSSNTMDLVWTDNAGNEEGFMIVRSLDGATWDPPVSVGPDVTAFLDTDLSPDTTYYYRVLAFNGYGDSAWSNTASDTTHPESSFIIQTVDPDLLPEYLSHAFHPVTGFPGIGYSERNTNQIKFAQWNGQDWEVEVLPVGGGTNVEFAYSPDGVPSLSFLQGAVYFAEKIGPTWAIESVTSGGDFKFPCLAYDPNGIPSVAYTQTWFKKERGLKLASRIGTAWIPEMIEPEMPDDKSLAYDFQGYPAIAYRKNNVLQYAHFIGSGWDIEVVESLPGSGVFVDLAFDPTTGWPAMVHVSMPGPELDSSVRFIRWDGTAWLAETVAQGDVFIPALAYNDSGTPYISYITNFFLTIPGVPAELWIAHFDGIDWVHELVDQDVMIGFSMDLRTDSNGLPTVCYHSSTGGAFGLKFAFKETP